MWYKYVIFFILVISQLIMFFKRKINIFLKVLLMVVSALLIIKLFYISPSIKISYFFERFRSAEAIVDYERVGDKYLLIDCHGKEKNSYTFYSYNKKLGFYYTTSRKEECKIGNLNTVEEPITLYWIEMNDYYVFFCNNLWDNDIKLLTKNGEVELQENKLLVVEKNEFDNNYYILNGEKEKYGLFFYFNSVIAGNLSNFS